MSDGWLDPGKYEHVPVLDCTGPGTMLEGYAWKVVLHTTESAPGTGAAVVALFQAKPCYCPQFMLDFATGRRVQFIPWTWSAAALRGGCSGQDPETNRARCIQVECVGRANDAADWSDDELRFIADWIADLVADGAPVNLDMVTTSDYQGTVATESSLYRMHGTTWAQYPGICGHIDVPCNDHYDPYRARKDKIAEFAKEIVGGTPITPPAPTPVTPLPTGRPEFVEKGMQGGIVEFGQQLLAGLGYVSSPPDEAGVFGDGTEAAVRSFQTDHGCGVDGVIGPETVAAIAKAYHPELPVPTGSPVPWPGQYLVVQSPMISGPEVWAVQTKLAQLGYNIGANGVDTIYGNDSAAAVHQFQVDHGLAADSVVGPNTWNALVRS